MPFIALSPTDPAGFFISFKGSWQWDGIPEDLDAKLREVSSRNETLVGLSLGLEGDWFLRTDKNHYCYTSNVLNVRSNVVNFLEYFTGTGVDLSGYNIDIFTFLPNPAGCIGVMVNPTLKQQRTYWAHGEPSLENHLQAILPSITHAIKCIAAGKNGAWVVIQGDGTVDYHNVPAELEEKIKASAKGSIHRIVLSLADESHWALEYTDSSIAYNLHPKVAPIFMEKWNEEQKYLAALNKFILSQQILGIQGVSKLQAVNDHSIWAPVAAAAAANHAMQTAAPAFR